MIENSPTVANLVPKMPAVMEVASQVPSLMDRAGGIFDSIRALAENPAASIETIGLGLAGMAAVASTLQIVSKYRHQRGEEDFKKAAEKSGRQWAQADGSLIAYAGIRGMNQDRALVSATSDVNRFMARSDPRAQALDIALRLSPEERAVQSASFEGSLNDFSRLLPKDAGIAQNHATLARLAATPIEAAATGERAAFGALDRGDAITSGAREACFALLAASACRAVAIEMGERSQEGAPKAVTQAAEAGAAPKARGGWAARHDER